MTTLDARSGWALGTRAGAKQGSGMSRSDEAADRRDESAAHVWAAAAAIVVVWLPATGQAQSPAQPIPEPNAQIDQAQAGPAVLLEADELVNDEAAGTITATGNVEARYEGRTLRADRVVYDLKKRTVRAQGRVEILDADGTVRFAEDVEVDEALNAGVATQFSARIPGGGTAAAASAITRPDGVNQLNRVVYTACPVCKEGEGGPTWRLRARKASQNPNTDMISYRDVVIQVHGVPVIYLPYFAHPDPSAGRKSGFLAPDLGNNRRLGTFYEQPYYWALSPYQDLTVSPQFHSNVNPLLNLSYRKRFYSGAVSFEGGLTYESDFDNDGERFGQDALRSHVFGQGAFRINDYWDWGFNVARASDDLYIKRYDIAGDAPRQGRISSDLSRLFSEIEIEGQDTRSYTNLAFIAAQGLREGDTEAELPLVLPVGEVERVYRDPLFDGQLKLRGSTANLVRSEGVDSARVSGGVAWNKEAVFGPGLVAGPFVEGRSDLYRVSNYSGAEESETISRNLGMAGVELRWPLMRAGEALDVVIEPIAMAVVGSNGGSDSRIPNEDSISFELDDSNLFRANVVPNYDLWESGARVSVGVRATASTAIGDASVVFGRRWRADEDDAFDPTTNLDGEASDYVGSVSADLGRHFGGQVRARLDEESLAVNRLDATLRAALWRVSASARYFTVDEALRGADPSQEIAATVGVQLSRSWNLSHGIRRDLDSAINLSQDTRLSFRDDCTFLEFAYSRTETSDRQLGPSEGFQIRIGLSTLGMFGGGE